MDRADTQPSQVCNSQIALCSGPSLKPRQPPEKPKRCQIRRGAGDDTAGEGPCGGEEALTIRAGLRRTPSIAPAMATTAANARQICATSSPLDTLSKRRVATRLAASTMAATATRAQAAPRVPACGTLQSRSGIEHHDSERRQRRADPRAAKGDEHRPGVRGAHVDVPPRCREPRAAVWPPAIARPRPAVPANPP